jgi:hypothetical protein
MPESSSTVRATTKRHHELSSRLFLTKSNQKAIVITNNLDTLCIPEHPTFKKITERLIDSVSYVTLKR